MPIDPSTLAPGQRVKLFCPDFGERRQDYEWQFLRAISERVYVFLHGAHTLTLLNLDGTLRDNTGRIVEVRDAD